MPGHWKFVCGPKTRCRGRYFRSPETETEAIRGFRNFRSCWWRCKSGKKWQEWRILNNFKLSDTFNYGTMVRFYRSNYQSRVRVPFTADTKSKKDFLIKPRQTFRNKKNEKNRPKTTVTEINQKYPEFFLNEIDRSHVGLKTQLLSLWRFKRFTLDFWRLFYLVGKLIDRRQAVDEPRVLLDLFAYFGESVLESLKHDDDNDDEAVDRSRMRAWLCLFALLETEWASLQRL